MTPVITPAASCQGLYLDAKEECGVIVEVDCSNPDTVRPHELRGHLSQMAELIYQQDGISNADCHELMSAIRAQHGSGVRFRSYTVMDQRGEAPGIRVGRGVICYDTHNSHQPWWMSLECSELVSAAYQRTLRRHGVDLVPLRNRAHVTVVRSEMPGFPTWGLREGEEVLFTYNYPPQVDRGYWFMKIECPELLDLREYLGLHRDPTFPLHWTLGKVRDDNKKGFRRWRP